MRLREVERGDRLVWRLMIRGISLMSRMRLPDAARIVLFHCNDLAVVVVARV